MLYLAQSDTTVGFVSSDATSINRAKNRPLDQKVLLTVASLALLKTEARVPRRFRSLVRRKKKTTFLMPNGNAYRIVDPNSMHHHFLAEHGILFSSSANLTGKPFDYAQAFSKVDVIVKDSRGFFEAEASTILKIGRTKKRKVRS